MREKAHGANEYIMTSASTRTSQLASILKTPGCVLCGACQLPLCCDLGVVRFASRGAYRRMNWSWQHAIVVSYGLPPMLLVLATRC